MAANRAATQLKFLIAPLIKLFKTCIGAGGALGKRTKNGTIEYFDSASLRCSTWDRWRIYGSAVGT